MEPSSDHGIQATKKRRKWVEFFMLSTNLKIPPSKLDHDWKTFLLETLCHQFLHSCIPRCGYITEIHGIDRIKDLCVTSIMGDVQCRVDFTASALIPRTHTHLESNIDLINDHGILMIHPYMNIFLPSRYLKRDGFELTTTFGSSVYSYRRPLDSHDSHDSSTKDQDDPFSYPSTLSLNSSIVVELVRIRFENNRFCAIARLCHPFVVVSNKRMVSMSSSSSSSSSLSSSLSTSKSTNHNDPQRQKTMTSTMKSMF